MTSGTQPGAPAVEEFAACRPRMFGIAYRMLGSADEAEDVVQDAYLRWDRADRSVIEWPAAWLAKVVTHLCVNRLTSARARRETYPGPWLPEPVLTGDEVFGPVESAERRDSVSTALLVLLERLTPTERAVYVLREAFGYSHRDIAGVLDLGEANCRQLYRRAVRRVTADRTRAGEEAPAARPAARCAPPSEERWGALVESFVAASREGDLARLERLLAEDVTWWSDGGGKVRAALQPVLGRDAVLRFLGGVLAKASGVSGTAGLELVVAEVNGAPALVAHAAGRFVAVGTFEAREGLITEVRMVMNPEKLTFAERQFAAMSHS
ncbi:RNA polymerase sigma factor SigJ [Streptomyces sp. NPDC053493]|uniref:RNA polymerase sigma factor SigJ n=1 Tax=Streptomyces sp. NPDC053493 TaxID=3365705 RepID=UPI0037D986FA